MCILDIFVSIIVTLGIFAIPSSTLTFKRLPIHKKMDPKPDTLHTDTFNESVSSILERKVRGWLSGVIDDMRRNSPVQQWLDSLPPDVETPNIVTTTEQSSAAETAEESKKTDTKSDENKAEDTVTENTVVENNIDLPHDDSDKTEVPIDKESIKTKLLETKSLSSKNKSKLKRDHSIQSEGNPPRFKNPLLRDHSLQSDGSGSSGSSVLNVLGARRVDAESVLLALGFGPSEKQQQLQRIPDRFLSPSKLKGISTEEFIKHEQHSMRMHDCGIFGYRGLTGNPHVPPSTIVAKIMDRIIQDDVFREEALIKARHSFADMRSSTAQSKIPTRLRST